VVGFSPTQKGVSLMSTDNPGTTAPAAVPTGREVIRSILQNNPEISVQEAESQFKVAMMGAGTPTKKFDRSKFFKERKVMFPDRVAASKPTATPSKPTDAPTKPTTPPKKKVQKKAVAKKATVTKAPAEDKGIPYTESLREFIFAALHKNDKANLAEISKALRESAKAAGIRKFPKISSSNFFRIRRLWLESVGRKVKRRRKASAPAHADDGIPGPEAGPRSRKLGRPFGGTNKPKTASHHLMVGSANHDAPSLESIEHLLDRVVMHALSLGEKSICDTVRQTRRSVSAKILRSS
jgi:hypothetical protein